MVNLSITIVSDKNSWINQYLGQLIEILEKQGHTVSWHHSPKDITAGDIAFFLSCGQIVPPHTLALNRNNIVVHESALPQGRGWSPLTWQILEGKSEVPITLFEAAESVDSGDIYLQDLMCFNGDELVDDLRRIQGAKTIELCSEFVSRYPEVLEEAWSQEGEPDYYPRRRSKDSQLDVDKSIKEQFDLLRVVDNERYPAFFELHGETYLIHIEKKTRT